MGLCRNKLKAARTLRGFSQADVAKVIGVSLATYNNKENGKKSFTVDDAGKIASTLKLSPQEVIEIFFPHQLDVM